MSNLPDYSEVERLRLQLYQTELQRDAFKAMAEARLDVLIREALAKQKPAESETHMIDEFLNMSDDKLLKRIETLEEDGNIMDGIVDRVSQRVDKLDDRVSSIRDLLADRIQHLLVRIEALESKRHG